MITANDTSASVKRSVGADLDWHSRTNGESLVSGWSESLDSITNHLAKLQFESPSVSDAGHDLLCCCLVADDVEFLVFMVLMKFSTVLAHTRHGVPTRGKRAQVPGTLPWWVRDCDSKVTGKVSVGHAGLRSTIATWPPRPS